MSLFRPDLWFPEYVDFQPSFLERPMFFVDYTAATLLGTFFLGAQVIVGGYILRQYLVQSRKRRAREPLLDRRSAPSSPWLYISMALVALYTASVILACVAYGERISSLSRLNEFSRTMNETIEWLRDTPGDHEGTKIICVPASVGMGSEELCKAFKLTKNILYYKRVEITFVSVVEAMIIMVDAILIYRFYMMFSTTRWIYPAIGVLILASLASPVIGVVALVKLAMLGEKSDPWWSANFTNKFLEWHSPWVAVVLPVFVNVAVTVAIITKIASTRRRLRNLVGKFPSDSVYLGVTATLVESALPSAVFGMLAAILHRVGRGDRIKFSPTMIWVAFTALSPQLIIIRVLQGRAWNKEVADSAWSSPNAPLVFACETQYTVPSETVDPELKNVA